MTDEVAGAIHRIGTYAIASSLLAESEHGIGMASADYFRKQAELCARLADAAAGGELALRFKLLELEFLFKATDAKRGADQVSIEPGNRREFPDTGG
jgi:hypothetical protein